jgi:hypothetical protein
MLGALTAEAFKHLDHVERRNHEMIIELGKVSEVTQSKIYPGLLYAGQYMPGA